MNDFLSPVYQGKSPPLTSIPGTRSSNSGNMLGSIISGVGSLANGVINAIQGNKNNKRQIEFAKWSQQQQERFAWDMFNAENRYNDPSAQAERLLRAGLNPALMYGSGVGSTGEASGGQTLSAPTPSTSPVPSFLQNLVGSNPFESLTALLGTQKAKSDIENTNMDTQKKESEKNKLDKEVDILKIEEEKKKYDTVIAQIDSKYHEEIVRQGIEKEYQEINNLVQNAVNAATQNNLMQSEINLNKALENLNNWKSYEISQLIKPQVESILAQVKKAIAEANKADTEAWSIKEMTPKQKEKIDSDLQTAFGNRVKTSLDNYFKANGLDNPFTFGSIQSLKVTGQLNEDNIVKVISEQTGDSPEKIRKAIFGK